MKAPAEYIWIEGTELKSKTLMLDIGSDFKPENAPDWDIDAGDQTLIMRPVYYAEDPARGRKGILFLTELYKNPEEPADTNHRAKLRISLASGTDAVLPVFAIQQCALGGVKEKLPPSTRRKVIETHIKFCNEAGLDIEFYDASSPGTIEFGIDLDNEKNGGALYTADQLWVARWLLEKSAEAHDTTVRFDKSHTLTVESLRALEDGTVSASQHKTSAEEDPYCALLSLLDKKEVVDGK